MAQRYRVGGDVVAADDGTFQDALKQAQSRKSKVFCLCRKSEGLRMYVSKRAVRYVLARWPGSGAQHSTSCDHFEAPDNLTGMGQVRGGAVVEDEESGEAHLKVQFPLTRGAARAAPTALSNDKPAVKSTGQKLTMRGLLQFLWDKAELTHWHPKMEGKRSWFVVRRALLEAASGCRLKQKPLTDVLFVPETFDDRNIEPWRARRDAALQRVRLSRDAMLMVVGEWKQLGFKNHGERVELKHAGVGFAMDADMAKRFHKQFGDMLEAKENFGFGVRIVFMGSFSGSREGALNLVECTMMLTTRDWIPFETANELNMISSAVASKRRFVKAMRINLARDVPIASLFLKDTGEHATAVYSLDTAAVMSEEWISRMESESVDHFVWGVPVAMKAGEVPAKPALWPQGKSGAVRSLVDVIAEAKHRISDGEGDGATHDRQEVESAGVEAEAA